VVKCIHSNAFSDCESLKASNQITNSGSKMTNQEFTTFTIVSTCKGGGYMYCRTEPLHPKRNSKGLYPLHRVLAENKLGRFLENWENVHHKDENKANNHPDNLEIMSQSDHVRLHQEVEMIQLQCPVCFCMFSLKPHRYRLRAKRLTALKDQPLTCSRSCSGKLQYFNRF
jgi:hypothetical protein